MEASFKSRVKHAFGAFGADSWTVSEVAIPRNLLPADESSGSDSDTIRPCAARYEKFRQLAKRGRRRSLSEAGEGSDEENHSDEGGPSKSRRCEELVVASSAENGQQNVDEDEESRQVRLMVGMDDTLDFEEEEDEYDKVAVGREDAGERVYMSEIKGATSETNALTLLPDSEPSLEKRKFKRDSRANHAAAAARLKEDERLATIQYADVASVLRSSSSSGTASTRESSGNDMEIDVPTHPQGSGSLKSSLKGSVHLAENGSSGAHSSKMSIFDSDVSNSNARVHRSGLQSTTATDSGVHIRDKENLDGQGRSDVRTNSKPKRVRFAEVDAVIPEEKSVSGKDAQQLDTPERVLKEWHRVQKGSQRYSRVPDHVRNPNKYTHYTLEWSDEEEDTKENLKAFHDTRAMTLAADIEDSMDLSPWSLAQAGRKEETVGNEEETRGNHSEEESFGFPQLPKPITFIKPRSGRAANRSNGDVKQSIGAGFQQTQALVSFAEVVMDGSSQSEVASRSSLNASTEGKSSRVFRKRGREEGSDDANAL